MDKEDILHCHLDQDFTDGAGETTDEVGEHEFGICVCFGHPDAYAEVDDAAANVDWSSAIFGSQRNEEDGPDAQADAVDGKGVVLLSKSYTKFIDLVLP